MKVVSDDVDRVRLLIGQFGPRRVYVSIDFGLDEQTALVAGRLYEIEDDLMADKRTFPPIHGHE